MILFQNQQFSKEYYYDLMSMFLRESLGIKTRSDYLASLVENVSGSFNDVFAWLDIWCVTGKDSKYYAWDNDEASAEASQEDMLSYENYFLDAIGSFLGISRTFTINTEEPYVIGESSVTIDEDTYTVVRDADGNIVSIDDVEVDSSGLITIDSKKYQIDFDANLLYDLPITNVSKTFNTKKQITLNNYEFLRYLRVEIVKANYYGTREELANLYQPTKVAGFIYVPTSFPATVNIYWTNTSFSPLNLEPSVNFKYLFLNGYLTIESVGIIYNKFIGEPRKTAIYDTSIFDDPTALWAEKTEDTSPIINAMYNTSKYDYGRYAQ